MIIFFFKVYPSRDLENIFVKIPKKIPFIIYKEH